MAIERDINNNYSIHNDGTIGEVHISDEVVTVIAGLAATEVKGVASLLGDIKNDMVAKQHLRHLTKGCKISVEDGVVNVNLVINVLYGYNIPEVTEAVQERVGSAIETMTGLSVEDVAIRIAGVVVPDEE